MDDEDGLDVALVGVCGAGKSTVAQHLRAWGYRIREIHQEHSYVPHMWRTIHPPEALVFLDVSYEEAYRRKPHSDYGPQKHAELQYRLRDARARADVYVLGDGMASVDVARQVAQGLDTLQQTRGGPNVT